MAYEDPPIKRIVRSKKNNPLLITDINVRLWEFGDEIDLLQMEAYRGDYYRSLSELSNSADLDFHLRAGDIEIETEDGTIIDGAAIDSELRSTYLATLWDVVLVGGGGSGTDLSQDVEQTAHGLSVGEAVYFDGIDWLLALASDSDMLGIGIVSAVADVDNFTVIFTGLISDLTGLTSGEYYFVSTVTPGLLVSTKPTSGFENPLMFATSTTEAIVLPYRPSQETDAGSLTFTDLSDTPDGHSGFADYFIKVKRDETGLEYTQETEAMFAQQVDFVGDTLIYRAEADPGAQTFAAVWRIRKIEFVGVDEDIVTEWADGDSEFDNIWDNRASLTYS